MINKEKVLQELQADNGSYLCDKAEASDIYSENRFIFNVSDNLKGIIGVDLTKIFCISELIETEIIYETGIYICQNNQSKNTLHLA